MNVVTDSGPGGIRQEFRETVGFAKLAVVEARSPRANIMNDEVMVLAPWAEPIRVGGAEDDKCRATAACCEVAWARIVAKEKIDASENVDQLIHGESRQHLITQRSEAGTVTIKIAD